MAFVLHSPRCADTLGLICQRRTKPTSFVAAASAGLCRRCCWGQTIREVIALLRICSVPLSPPFPRCGQDAAVGFGQAVRTLLFSNSTAVLSKAHCTQHPWGSQPLNVRGDLRRGARQSSALAVEVVAGTPPTHCTALCLPSPQYSGSRSCREHRRLSFPAELFRLHLDECSLPAPFGTC